MSSNLCLTHVSGYILLQTVFFRPTPTKIYRLSYTGALLSYTIVVLKSLGRPSPDAAWLRRAFVDENVQYMVLAMYWWISKPLSSASHEADMDYANSSSLDLALRYVLIVPRLDVHPDQHSAQGRSVSPPPYPTSLPASPSLPVQRSYLSSSSRNTRPPAAAQGQPNPPPSAVSGLSQKIQVWVKGNYDGAMRFVAYAELAIFARVVVGALT